MNQSSAGPESSEVCAWIAFWAQLVVLAVLAMLGASFASADRAPGDYACGLLLSLAAIALAFMRLKNRFDGGAADWGSFLLVDDLANLLFAASGVAVFLSMKHVFDNADRTR